MGVIFHVLKEELDRLQETENAYKTAIEKLPKGSPRFLLRNKKKYLYLQYRKGVQVIQDYIGPQDSMKVKNILGKVEQRNRYEKLLKETKSALKEVRKALRGKI